MTAGHGSPPARVAVLGPLLLTVDGAAVDVRGPKRRVVLALLALAEGRAVTVDSLVDALWPAEVPDSGRQALHSHVSRLRAHLGPAAARLQTGLDGYRLDLGQDDLDLVQARALLAAARADADRDPAAALSLLREAHALWRGPVLADLTDVGPIAAAVQGCAHLHRDVTDAIVATAIAAGQANAVLDLAAQSLAADPLRESAVLLQMRALAATGRAPEALRTGREYRRRLADETGLDPSPALSEVERDIAGGSIGPSPNRPDGPAQPTTRLIGREAQVAALHRQLAAERLVTLVGPGGVGKTAVALEVARRSGAATVLLLAPVTDPAAIPHALAAALHLQVVQGDVLSACVALLGDRHGLLVADNCEHLLDAVRDTVGRILAGCPRLCVLATSREPLGLAAEYTSRLPPLRLPDPNEDLPQVPSVAVSSTAPPGSAPVRRQRPPSCRWLPTSRTGSTGCRWPSSSPLGGCPPSPFPTCTIGWTAPWTCSAAGQAPRPGTGRCARPWSGPTSCCPRTNGGCSGTCRSSWTASTWKRPSGSPSTWAWTGIPAACSLGSSMLP